MKKYVAAVVILVLIISVFAINSIAETKYEVQPQIKVDHYKSDSVRMIESYERLMNRYQDMLESSMVNNNEELKSIDSKLEAISGDIKTISNRLARIEKALGIKDEPTPNPEAAVKTIETVEK